jgi:uncharacterized protein (TIGR03032 family)
MADAEKPKDPDTAEKQEPAAAPLRSVSTQSFAQVLSQLGCSLIVTTYQAGKVIAVRVDEGKVNTHFRDFQKPMGVVADRARLTIGGANTVWFMRNVPAVAPKLEPAGKHDAAFLPRAIHVTGDIDIHEMAWADDDQLWIVNTRFSCLCTLDHDHSFAPRWRPHFVSALALEDRCHLNGLGLRDGKPRYATALGETDTARGWRDNKRSGGILMDIPENRVLVRGISMPHSPRYYRNKLYVLESGQGSIAEVDESTWKLRTIASLPGFTRGIDFLGPLAFIGLSQVRESATFAGLPLTERLSERTCGVWVVNIETGQIIAFLRFESGVQEIFGVQLLRGIRFPEIVPWNDPKMFNSYVLPDDALKDLAAPAPKA